MSKPSLSSAFRSTVLALLMVLCCAVGTVADETPTVEIFGAGSQVQRVAMATPLGAANRADVLQQDIVRNLSLVPFLQLINPNGIPGGAAVTSATGQGIDFRKFLLAGARMLVTTNWVNASQVELRAFDVADGRLLFGNRYAVGEGKEGSADVADKFCADFLEALIGNGDFFRSTLAFVKSSGRQKKDIWTVKPNGRNLRKITNISGESLSPSWSPDGRFIVFSNIQPRSHGLGIYSVASQTTQRITFPGNTVIGPCFLPDNRVAVSLTDGRNPSIFLLGHSFKKERPLENSAAIDVSPSIDASGSKMVFTSSRLGSPQIFLKDLRGGGVRRISVEGSYNTDPSISPDGTVVAYARLQPGGHKIFVYDLVTGREQQVSFGHGSDEEPAFAPDNYFIAFMSTRNGGKKLFLTTRNGGNAVALPTGPGDASFPSWWAPGDKRK